MYMEKIKVLIVDDHPLIRNGLRSLFINEEIIDMINEATDGEDMIGKLKDEDYNLILMDVRMPKVNGIEATKFVSENYPEIKVLALSTYDDDSHIVNMLEAGARGYLLKNASKDELMKAINTILNGESYFSQEVSSKLLNKYLKEKQPGASSDGQAIVPLTKREKEILKMIAEENTNQEIAEKLFISPRTVDTHRRNLLQKLNVKNTAGLVRYAFENNLLE